jgi:hypothetical protein
VSIKIFGQGLANTQLPTYPHWLLIWASNEWAKHNAVASASQSTQAMPIPFSFFESK